MNSDDLPVFCAFNEANGDGDRVKFIWENVEDFIDFPAKFECDAKGDIRLIFSSASLFSSFSTVYFSSEVIACPSISIPSNSYSTIILLYSSGNKFPLKSMDFIDSRCLTISIVLLQSLILLYDMSSTSRLINPLISDKSDKLLCDIIND